VESEKTPADAAIRNRYQGSTDNQSRDGDLRLGWGRPLWNGLVDVGIQLCQYRNDLVLVSRFIIAQPLDQRAYVGIVGKAGCLTIAFIELALHRQHLLQALPWSVWQIMLHRFAGLQSILRYPSKRPKMFLYKGRMLCIVAAHDFEPSTELLIGDRWDNLQDLPGEAMLSSCCLVKPSDQLDVLIGA